MILSIDFYKGFDEHFFDSMWREQSTLQYRTFLERHQPELTSLLTNPSQLLENRKRVEELEAISGECKHSRSLKYASGLTVEINDLMRIAGTSLSEDQQRYVNCGIHSHLARLMLPEEYSKEIKGYWKLISPQNTVCVQFGKDLIGYAARTPLEIMRERFVKTEADKFQMVIGTGGLDVFIFWTLAPYIHLNLRERGLSNTESMGRIVRWAVNAYEKHNGFGMALEHLDTIMDYYGYGGEEQRLGFDERMPSHLKARLLAREVAAELVK